MTPSNALQTMLFEQLSGAGFTVVDPGDDSTPYPYISFGPSDAIEDDADCITGLVETVQLDIWSNAQDGQREAKDIVHRCRRLLHGLDASLGEHAIVELRVSMTRVVRDPDALWHGIVTVEAAMEEAV